MLVAGGRGVGKEGMPLLINLAQSLHGELAGTRALVEEGMVESSRQVGQTGKTVKPDLYIAAGISGAIQHVIGMENSELTIAINTDKEAPIFKLPIWVLLPISMRLLLFSLKVRRNSSVK